MNGLVLPMRESRVLSSTTVALATLGILRITCDSDIWAGWELEGRDGEIEGLICADGMSSEELAKFGVTEFQKIPEEYFDTGEFQPRK